MTHSRLRVGQIDKHRSVECTQSATKQRAGDSFVLGDDRTDVLRQSPLTAEHKADHRALALSHELSRGQASAQAGEHGTAFGAKR